MEKKTWYKSSTIQAVLVGLLLVFCQIFGGDGEMADTIDKMGEMAGNNKELLLQIGTLLCGGAAIRGRLKAKTELTPIKKKEDTNGD